MSKKTYDDIVFDKKFEFDQQVTNAFGNMISRSIPEYDKMRKVCYDLGRSFLKPGKHVVDIGCSTGLAVEPFIQIHSSKHQYDLFEISESMLNVCREKFAEEIKHHYVRVEKHDLREGFYRPNACLVLSIFTLQFCPMEYRQKIVQGVYDSLEPGTAFLLFEKVLGESAEINELLVNRYLEMKREKFYSHEQVESKRKNLEGVLVPLTARWNEDLLRSTGFKSVDCVWRTLNFAGWLAIK